MELIFLKEPLQDLLLLAVSGGPAREITSGYLLGQKLNESFFVHKILPLSWSDLLNPEIFLQVEKKQPWEILGIFTFSSLNSKKKELQQPLFCEKLFLALKIDRKGEIKARAHLLQFAGRFLFVPVKRIILELEETND